MKRNILVLAGLGASLLGPAATSAQEIQYWGLWQGTDRGVIRLRDQYYTVGKGDEIPGIGKVEAVTNEVLTVERSFTAEERDAMQARGQLPIDAQIRRIPNLGNRVSPSVIRPAPLPGR